MITIVCAQCRTGIRSVGDEDEIYALLGAGSDWFPDRYPCPRDGCAGKAEYIEAIDSVEFTALEIHDLTAQEAFAAFNGLGFPEERDCGIEAVQRLFGTRKVQEVDVQQIHGTHRSVLHSITFEGGVRLYLASAAEGATVYRISFPHHYAEAGDERTGR